MGTGETGGPKRARRINFLRPVHLRTLDQAGPTKRMFASKLSQSGMFVRAPVPLPVGTRVEVFLEARGQMLRFGEAVVASVLTREDAQPRGRLPGFGIRFTALPLRSRALVQELLRLTPDVPRTPRPPAPPTIVLDPAPVEPGRRRTAARVAALATLGAAVAIGGWAQWAGLFSL